VTALRIGITCYPTFGGSGIVATEVGLALARRGHLVHFIASEVPGRLDTFQDNVFFHAVEVRDYPLFDHPYTLALASKMVEVATWENLDLLHVHYAVPHATSAYLARQILGARAPRLVTTLHGTDITLVGNDPSFLPITRFSIEQSDALTTPSAFLREATYDNLGIDRGRAIDVIPNFVDTRAFAPAPRDFRAIAHLFPCTRGAAPCSPPVVIAHNSNFRPLKRVEDVVRVFAAVRARRPALLVLVGDGPDRSRTEALVRELGLAADVCFLGKQLAFQPVLAQADVFLLPSQTEAFGLAALEAMACGVPVVATRVGGVPEVVVDGDSGLLFPPGDVAAMSDGVLALLDDPARRDRMAKAARARAETEYQPAPMIDRYLEIYERTLASPR
jgi:N-acetyl-alpha-D-glucosaminyl L-malate synthase BshA